MCPNLEPRDVSPGNSDMRARGNRKHWSSRKGANQQEDKAGRCPLAPTASDALSP